MPTRRWREPLGSSRLRCRSPLRWRWRSTARGESARPPGREPDRKADFPAPGSRHGITVERIRELIEYTHRKGALAMSFLNSNVEAADRDTIREVTLLMKQTGCDVHAIGDGGFGGGTWPENIYQMSVTLKGKAYTWAQMATPRR